MTDEQKIPPNRTPVHNPVPSFWTATTFPLSDHRTTPDLPTTSDIVVIGAGLAGVATAYHILKQHHGSTAEKPPPSVLILEARQICSGATGRNGGHIKPDVYFNVGKYASLYGMEAAAEMARFEAEHVYAVKDLIETEGLDCDFHLTRAVDVCLDADHARETEAAYRELVKAGVADLRDVDFTPKPDAERVRVLRGLGGSNSTPEILSEFKLTTKAKKGIWDQRCTMLLLFHCRTSLAIQTGPPAPATAH